MDHFDGKSLPNASLVEARGEKTKMNRAALLCRACSLAIVLHQSLHIYNITIIE